MMSDRTLHPLPVPPLISWRRLLQMLLLALACGLPILLAAMPREMFLGLLAAVPGQLPLGLVACYGSDPDRQAAAVAQLTNQTCLATVVRHASVPAVRSFAAGKLADQQLLMDLLVTDRDPAVRISAAYRVTDPRLQANRLRVDPQNEIRRYAAQVAQNPAALAEAVCRDPDWGVRDVALTNLVSRTSRYPVQLALGRIAESGGDSDRRIYARCELRHAQPLLLLFRRSDEYRRAGVIQQAGGDPVLLALGRQDPSPRVRAQAAAVTQDQATLQSLALDDPAPEVRRAAAITLRDPARLRQLAAATTDPEVRQVAGWRLANLAPHAAHSPAVHTPAWTATALAALPTDRASLMTLLTSDTNLVEPAAAALVASCTSADIENWIMHHEPATYRPELALVRAMNDQALLERLVRQRERPWLHRAAVGQLTDQARLRELALDRDLGDIREWAAGRLTDEAACSEVLLTQLDGGAAGYLAYQLQDRHAFAQLVRDSHDAQQQTKALHLMRRYWADDPTIDDDYATLALAGATGAVQYLAGTCLRDQAAMLRVVRATANADLRAHLAGNLIERAVLTDLRDHDPSADVRAAAAWRLSVLP